MLYADAESGIEGYTVGIGTAVGKMDIVKKMLPRTSQTVKLMVAVEALTIHNIYYATVIVKNLAGNSNSISSDGFMTTNVTNSRNCVAIA